MEHLAEKHDRVVRVVGDGERTDERVEEEGRGVGEESQEVQGGAEMSAGVGGEEGMEEMKR